MILICKKYFIVPNGHRKFGSLSPQKASCDRIALPTLIELIPNLLYAAFLCDLNTGCEAYTVATDGYGIFSVRANLGACRTHKGVSVTSKCAEELTRSDKKTHPVSPSSCQTRGSNPGSLDLNSDSIPLSHVPRYFASRAFNPFTDDYPEESINQSIKLS